MSAIIGGVDVNARLNELPRISYTSPTGEIIATPKTNALLAGYTGLAPLNMSVLMSAVMSDTQAIIKSQNMTRGAEVQGKYNPAQTKLPQQFYGSTTAKATSDKAAQQQGVDLTSINQLSYHGKQLGQGTSTMSGSGCALASLTMTINKLKRKNGDDNLLTMEQANDTIRDGGGFHASDLDMTTAGKRLGYKVQSQIASPGVVENAVAQAQDKPNTTGLFVGVHYRSGSASQFSGANHFLSVSSVDDQGNLHCLDPVNHSDKNPTQARPITLKRGADGVYRADKYDDGDASPPYAVADVRTVTQNDKPISMIRPIFA